MKVDIPAFEKARVLVVGDIMLDRYWYGPTQRISPEAPVPIVKIHQDEDRPGGAANVALNIASLNGHVTLLGITGEDEASITVQTQLAAMKINCQFIQSAAHPTITKLRILSRNQQLLRLDFEESFAELDKKQLVDQTEALIAQHDLLLLSDYNKGTLSDVQALIKIANAHNVPVLVDPKGSDFSRYRGATLITPNLAEFEAVATTRGWALGICWTSPRPCRCSTRASWWPSPAPPRTCRISAARCGRRIARRSSRKGCGFRRPSSWWKAARTGRWCASSAAMCACRTR